MALAVFCGFPAEAVGNQHKAAGLAIVSEIADGDERVLYASGNDGKVFGIPVEILRAAVRTTAAHGHVVVPWLGITGVDATELDEAGFDGGAAIQKVVPGSPANIKITHRHDLAVAEALLRADR